MNCSMGITFRDGWPELKTVRWEGEGVVCDVIPDPEMERCIVRVSGEKGNHEFVYGSNSSKLGRALRKALRKLGLSEKSVWGIFSAADFAWWWNFDPVNREIECFFNRRDDDASPNSP